MRCDCLSTRLLSAGSCLQSILALALSGCATTAVPGTTPTATPKGFLELAISETCTKGSDPQCILIGDDYVMHPATFEDAPVANAAASEGEQQDAVDITFTAEGAAVLHDLTGQAAQAGGDSRLLLKAGGEIIGHSTIDKSEGLFLHQLLNTLV